MQQRRSEARERAARWLAHLLRHGERSAQQQPRTAKTQGRSCRKQRTKEVEK
jgi:hypothetical protein